LRLDVIREAYLWACERLYHELAGSYDLISRLVSAGAWPAWRRTALEHVRGPRVLEIGFGTGELLAEMAARGWDVHGLELSAAMQRVTTRRLAQAGMTAPRVQATAQVTPFANRSFDTVVATFPAPYILDPRTVTECVRVLDAQGRLVVAGLWVRLQNERLRQALPLFYADPTQAQLAAISQPLQGAGFVVQWHMPSAGWAQVPVLVAEKC
jgi:ubiquinone/menaquinone biosynthesis C-methylase UbiE